MLIKFWEKELEIVRKAMGFRYKAHIQFDQMTLSDEAAEKNLLIQLADRDIISHETLLERFKEIPQIENIRLKREINKRDTVGPDKASPFHNANHKQDMEKIDKQGKINKQNQPKQDPEQNEKPSDPNGRPLFKKDDGPRKKRVETPKNKPGVAELIVWSEQAWEKTSNVISQSYLKSKGLKNLRQLTKSDSTDIEKLKLDVFTNLPVMEEVNQDVILNVVKSGKRTPNSFKKALSELSLSPEDTPIDLYRKSIIGLFVEAELG